MAADPFDALEVTLHLRGDAQVVVGIDRVRLPTVGSIPESIAVADTHLELLDVHPE